MSSQNQVRALSRIRRALVEAEREVIESEREYLEAGGVMPAEVDNALRTFHARVRVVNGALAAHAKDLNAAYDDDKTPARTPSALMRAVSAEDIQEAFANSIELAQGKKKPT